MKQVFNINEFVFGRTKAEKKLEVLDSLNGTELRKATDATILRIYKECRNGRDRFCIKNDRRAGNLLGGTNFWNSLIEFISEYNGRAYICFYVQNSSTDSSVCVSYDRFKSDTEYCGYCDNISTRFRYDSADIANVIRCILKEFVYYKYIERAEREKAEKLATIAGWQIINPVVNYFYKAMRLDNLPFSYATTTPRYDQYCKGKEALEEYPKEHFDELYGKSVEELQAIYKEVFRKAANW